MKIFLLGATGRTGKLVLQLAIKKGYKVNCLVRNPEKIEIQNNISIFKGSPSCVDDLRKAMEGCNCIISVLNISRNSDFPWSKIRTPKYFLSDVMSKTLAIATDKNVQRIIICSAWGVSETKHEIPKWFKWLIENSNIAIAYEDHERQEKLLQQATLNWTIVRLAGLTNSNKKQTVRESFNNNPRPKLTISRLALAKYMIETIEKENSIGKKVVVSKE
ncbi:MAG: NAD(P)H-binding protein [Cellulophaga sp.]